MSNIETERIPSHPPETLPKRPDGEPDYGFDKLFNPSPEDERNTHDREAS
jgi:hypothetical protein